MAYSPPSRFACITAQHIGLDITIREVDMLKGEHRTPEYIAINPTQTVPALKDGDVSVFDSSAISIYLADKYAKDDSVYPKDVALRAKVNERLFYVASYIFPRLYQICVPIYFGGATGIPQDKLDQMYRGYGEIEAFLAGSNYLAGDNITLPDLYLWAIMESQYQIIPIDAAKYPKFDRWFAKMREHPSFEFNKAGAVGHIAWYNECLQKNIEAAKGK